MISGGFIKNVLGTVMSEKQKFKVCKTDLGMDKVYPEGSVVELDVSQDWVQELIYSGNLVPVREETEGVKDEETERLREEEKLKADDESQKSKVKGQKSKN